MGRSVCAKLSSGELFALFDLLTHVRLEWLTGALMRPIRSLESTAAAAAETATVTTIMMTTSTRAREHAKVFGDLSSSDAFRSSNCELRTLGQTTASAPARINCAQRREHMAAHRWPLAVRSARRARRRVLYLHGRCEMRALRRRVSLYDTLLSQRQRRRMCAMNVIHAKQLLRDETRRDRSSCRRLEPLRPRQFA